jgi:flagellar biosynthesis/type III secretory pathway M-ring protein FliF/YscJ
MLELPANLVSFVVFDRTRVCLAFTQTEFREHVKNLSALDFQLAREIVNSNLAQYASFQNVLPKALSRS